MIYARLRKMAGMVVIWAALVTPAFSAAPIDRIYAPWGVSTGWPIYAIPSNKVPTDPAVIYVSMDRGNSWDAVVGLPSTFAEPTPITSFAYSTDTLGKEHLFVGTDGEGVFRSDNGGHSWEKWNDADVAIIDLVAGTAITSDRATFATTDHGENWTQNQAMPLTASTVATGGDGTLVGSTDGNVYWIGAATAENLTTGQRGVGPLGGIVRDIVVLNSYSMVAVEKADGNRRLYIGSQAPPYVWWSAQLVNGALANATLMATAGQGVAIINENPDPELLVSCDKGDTWLAIPTPVTTGINDMVIGGCSGVSTRMTILLATDEGGFRSIDDGVTWEPLGDIGGPETGSIRIAHSDLGVHMVSPSPETSMISRSQNRFELDVTNHGNERVEDIVVQLEFTVWYEGSSQGSSSWGTSTTIDGVECERTFDVFGNPTNGCSIPSLESGDSARIVINHGLGENAFSMRLEASVDSEKLRDPILSNNRFEFSPSVRNQADIGGEGGGGGSVSLLLMLALLSSAMLRRLFANSLVTTPFPPIMLVDSANDQCPLKKTPHKPGSSISAMMRRVAPQLRHSSGSTCHLGPLFDKIQFDRVRALIQIGIDEGTHQPVDAIIY